MHWVNHLCSEHSSRGACSNSSTPWEAGKELLRASRPASPLSQESSPPPSCRESAGGMVGPIRESELVATESLPECEAGCDINGLADMVDFVRQWAQACFVKHLYQRSPWAPSQAGVLPRAALLTFCIPPHGA